MSVTDELPPWSVVSPKRAEHIGRVVALIDGWALARGVSPGEAARWHRAAVLHDALRDAGPDVLARYLPRGDWPLALWHGPAAAAALRADGETDAGLLDAVTWHSVGCAGWEDVGRAVYLADYLEPGRAHRRAERAVLAARVPAEFHEVVREVASTRIRWLVESGQPVRKETWAFWNHLVGDATSSS